MLVLRTPQLSHGTHAGDFEVLRLLLDESQRYYENILDEVDRRRLARDFQASDTYAVWEK